eukprot:355955-Chlamydomonas_euryale.AAC.2
MALPPATRAWGTSPSCCGLPPGSIKTPHQPVTYQSTFQALSRACPNLPAVQVPHASAAQGCSEDHGPSVHP